jgi:hypothetical protein
MTPDEVLAVGTRKGLFLARSSGGGAFELDPVHFSTVAVHAVAVDTRRETPRVLAAIEYGHFGPSVMWSDDLGATWREAERAPVAFPEHTGTALQRVWQLRPSPSEPDVVWAGAEPGALFRSEDGGVTYDLVEPLWAHPHRAQWQPGGGGLCMHTVLPHPGDPKTLGVAVSTGGFYRSFDGGTTWEAANRGIYVPFLPEEADRYPEFGQCVHKVDFHPSRPDRLYLQHHFGVYRSDDFGGSWTPIGEGLPSDFGFPVAVHPDRPDTLFVFPLRADVDRTPVDHRPAVYRSDDAGGSWRRLDAGLPDRSYAAVLRDAMCASAPGVFFGTRDGEVYGSRDDGESWTLVARHLPDVLTVRAARLHG